MLMMKTNNDDKEKNSDDNEDKHMFQTYARERVLPDNTLTDDFFESFEPSKTNIKIHSISTDTINGSDISSSENSQLRKINLELYQYAISNILDDS